MNFVDWYKKRGTRFIFTRAKKLAERYDFNPGKAISRIRYCVGKLSEYGCHPSFFVPAIVVRRNSDFIHELQENGCEIGVHGYQHIDMRSIPPQDANRQLVKAAEVFIQEDIKIDGFRCPYLSISDEILQELQPGLFNYSSNRAIAWVNNGSNHHEKNLLFDTIGGFYQPSLAQSTLSLPYQEEQVLEIPVSVPDDLQMRDGLNYTEDEISASLLDTFNNTHQRGELYNLMFHPELASLLIEPFLAVLDEAYANQQGVWISQLRDISEWWKEKTSYRIHIDRLNGKYQLVINCPKRATLLQRGLEEYLPSSQWDEKYRKLESDQIVISNDILPLVGISPELPDWVYSSLNRMGYISVNLNDELDCSVRVTSEFLRRWDNPVKLIAAIEDLDIPLVRFWPWPDGNRSALCLSGDLDALSLMDYATRLLPM